MKTYHFCILGQDKINEIRYYSGILTCAADLTGDGEYDKFVKAIGAAATPPIGKPTVISLTVIDSNPTKAPEAKCKYCGDRMSLCQGH